MFSNVEAFAIVNTATQASCIPSSLGQAIDLAMYRHFVCYSFYRKKLSTFCQVGYLILTNYLATKISSL